ncbi:MULTISPECIES: hypothetical protein [Bizionia]|uniref:Uncharacterized protein n=1 Tax=Bizionia algoritergicola TaxID=291187 RepID=A0A5D0R2L4_9FLAO|nr:MULTISPECIES: hypothetical protein [Bizionia]TYB75245.1 hypothetical protein ES675_03725 [Bizionia algoritergicola]
MTKKAIAILFSILFLAFISAPSIIIAIDDNVDVSMFYSIAEEENENIKFPLAENDLNEVSHVFLLDSKEHVGYMFKYYPKPHLNLISPPPDFI